MIDLAIENIGRIVTSKSVPWRAGDDIEVIENATIEISNGSIVEIKRGRSGSDARAKIDAEGMLVTSALYDAHTHMLFYGERSWELSLKLQGVRYDEILRRGGGIYSTVQATEKASDEELSKTLSGRLEQAMVNGTAGAEVKTGYASSPEGERRLLRIIKGIKNEVSTSSTLLMHVPPKGMEREEYVNGMIESLEAEPNFADVFCDKEAFTPEESERFLRAASEKGIGLRLHADEIEYIGCSDLVSRIPLKTLDHLLKTPPEVMEKIAQSNTAAVLLPCTALSLMTKEKPRTDVLRKENGIMALGTDFSPNSWCFNMQTAMELSTYLYGLTPLEALMAATANSAYSLGLEGRGIIKKGAKADLIIWKVEKPDWLTYWFGENKIKKLIVNGKLFEARQT
ncbi:MAG: imidazolonepropionase [TACK group archaeon]|nr:imidazolonepropionase [TACK group archaeon]